MHLPQETSDYVLVPLRHLSEGFVQARSISGTINGDTVKNTINAALIEAYDHEKNIYTPMRLNIETYFTNPEKPELIKEIILTTPLNLMGEIDDPQGKIRPTNITIPMGTKVKAIEDRASWNLLGAKVYIVQYQNSYFFCPADNCELAT